MRNERPTKEMSNHRWEHLLTIAMELVQSLGVDIRSIESLSVTMLRASLASVEKKISSPS